MHVMAEGTLQLKTSLGKLSLPNSLVVPSASSVLIPLGSCLNDGATCKGYKGGANLFYKNNCLIRTTEIVNNILLIDTPPDSRACVSVKLDTLIINKQLGHSKNFVASKIFPSVDFSKVNCISCSPSKSYWLPFSGSFPAPASCLDMVHMEICVPISPKSCGRNRYVFQLIYGYSRMCFIYLLKSKYESFGKLFEFQILTENQTCSKIKTVTSDNGGEFINSRFQDLFSKKGIIH
ncbi:hypothetical protein O181_129853 [Austropuccinia psidii MF-1]|uniref:Integrase catalytic domain-containing protein n=1 Tax=Austropuccinia psidii MF-1 TaxID=1389203 RepID=A0A9Q3KYX4_9BASI|nr:hypothetical protein [Austropuccinia psidii MF-1]